MIGFAIGFSIASMCLSIVSIAVAAWALIDVQAFRRSTHQIQYVPVDDSVLKKEQDQINKQYADIAQQSWDNLGTTDPKDLNV